MKVINENKRLLFTLKEKTSGILVIAPEELILVDESLKQTTPVDPRPYKVYTALLTQSGTNAPVATVLENTLGEDILWSYEGVGSYTATSNNLFTLNKTGVLHKSIIGDDLGYSLQSYSQTINSITFSTSETNTGQTDGILLAPELVEIRVYN